jgi:pimeloyl-ACP methyl ester carboxylesterase
MTSDSLVAETKFVEANEVRYAYREMGPKGGVPLVLCHRFRGTMDDWDPALIDVLATQRHVIIFDSAGVGLSSGQVPSRIKAMANHAVDFIAALGYAKIDLFGFSMGGFVAQIVTLDHPALVRRLILAGTGPGGAEGLQVAAAKVFDIAGRADPEFDDFLYLFFSPSVASRAAAVRYWERLHLRGPDRAPPVQRAGIDAQMAAVAAWTLGECSSYKRLDSITQPVFVANGNNDLMIPTSNSFVLSQRLGDCLLIIYPDSGHGFLFQYPARFAQDVLVFLSPS